MLRDRQRAVRSPGSLTRLTSGRSRSIRSTLSSPYLHCDRGPASPTAIPNTYGSQPPGRLRGATARVRVGYRAGPSRKASSCSGTSPTRSPTWPGWRGPTATIYWYNDQWYAYTGTTPDGHGRLGLGARARPGDASRRQGAVAAVDRHRHAVRDGVSAARRRRRRSAAS